LPEQLTANERAVVVSLGSPQSVGGQITAGSHVDVWVTFSGQSGNGSSRPIVKLLYQNMYVLGINGSNVTFRATPTQAGTLIYASQNAQIWLTLRPTNGTTPKPPAISAAAVVGGVVLWFTAPAGKHAFRLVRHTLPVEMWGWWLSGLSLALLLVWSAAAVTARRRAA